MPCPSMSLLLAGRADNKKLQLFSSCRVVVVTEVLCRLVKTLCRYRCFVEDSSWLVYWMALVLSEDGSFIYLS